MTTTCLLCGDPQQPSEYMYESVRFLEARGVEFERMDWKADVSAETFREITMEMEERGPAEYDASAIEERVDGVDVLVVHKAPVSAALLDAGGDLEIVGAARGGTENVDVAAAADRGLTVLHAPGRNRNAVADYAVGLVLAHVRRIPYHDAALKAGDWELSFDPTQLPRDMESLTLGVVGFGNVGRGVARRAQGFGTDVVVHDPYVDDETIGEFGAEPADLDGLLSMADAVTLHVRLSEETHNLLGAEEFGTMRDSAVLVNTARGGLVDEGALVDALRNGEIGGAALDVFETEPIPDDHPFLEMDDVILSPHTAGSTRDAVLNGSKIVAEDVAHILDGEEPEHVVDRP